MLPFLLAGLAAIRRTQMVVPLCAISSLIFLALRLVSVWTGDPFSVKMSATHLRLDALLFGVGIRGAAQYFPQRFMAARRWRSVLVAAGILCWSPNVFIEPSTAFVRTFGLTATYLGSAAFLLAAYHTHAADFGRWKSCVSPVASLVAWIGVYSYTIYLIHVTTMGIMGREFAGRLAARMDGFTSLSWLICALGVSAGAVLAGVLLSKLVEWPVLRFRDRIFPSRSRALPLASAVAHPDTQPAEQVPISIARSALQ